MVYEKTVFVKRRKLPIVSGEVDKIDVRELYDGRDNPLNIDFEKRIKFTCFFDNIKNYPFGMQVRFRQRLISPLYRLSDPLTDYP